MEDKRELEVGKYIIPNKLHAVWLGKVLDKQGRENVAAWRWKNRNYESNLWIDSSTYSAEGQPALVGLLNWAKENNINICDVNPNPPWKIKHSNYIHRPDIYEKMSYKQYYNDEVSGQYPNYAAASDMLRAIILYTDGGIYFDARDVNPPVKLLPKVFRALNDFLFHVGIGIMNNDILAAVPESVDLGNYMEAIKEQYQKLYEGSPHRLEAHRNPNREGLGSGFGTRRITTMGISGPTAMINSLIKHYDDWMDALHLCKFPPNYYTEPLQQDISWFDPTLLEDEKHILILFGNSVKDYLTDDFLGSKIQKLSKQPMFQNSALKNILTQLQQGLSAFDRSQMSLLQMYNSCVADIKESKNYQDLSKKEKAMYKDILSTIRKCMKSAEKLIELGNEHQVDTKSIFEMLSRASPRANIAMSERINFGTFVTEVLLAANGKPNLQAVQKYGIQYNQPEPKHPPSQSNLSNI